jgi:F0F1-type ATP synthase membrane subunit b/b'
MKEQVTEIGNNALEEAKEVKDRASKTANEFADSTTEETK